MALGGVTTIEAHVALMIASLANLVGILLGVAQIKRLRSKLNGHLRAHHETNAESHEARSRADPPA